MQYAFKFQNICYRTKCIYGIPYEGSCKCINLFGHEQYPFNNIDPWCLITKYPNEGIDFLIGFGKVMQFPSTFPNICYGT